MCIDIFLKQFFNRYYKQWSLDIAIRYLPIVYAIYRDQIKDANIIEIGSGSFGITPYLNRSIVGVDINFGKKVPSLLKPVRASAFSLPFADNEFDIAICADVLEHIKPELRVQALLELIRVIRRKAYITMPTGKAAQKQDRELRDYFIKIHGNQMRWIREHIENVLPSEHEMEEYFQQIEKLSQKQLIMTKSYNTNIHFRNIYMRLYFGKNRFLNRLFQLLSLFAPIFQFIKWGEYYRILYEVNIKR